MDKETNQDRLKKQTGRSTQDQTYDEATAGKLVSDTAPSGGGRAIDQLTSDLKGSPLDDGESEATPY